MTPDRYTADFHRIRCPLPYPHAPRHRALVPGVRALRHLRQRRQQAHEAQGARDGRRAGDDGLPGAARGSHRRDAAAGGLGNLSIWQIGSIFVGLVASALVGFIDDWYGLRQAYKAVLPIPFLLPFAALFPIEIDLFSIVWVFPAFVS